MTKSTITRERLEQLENFKGAPVTRQEEQELARMALAALDSEPVAYTDERNLSYIDRGRETAYLWGKQNSEASDVALYRHAQPAPVVSANLLHTAASAIEDLLTTKDRTGAGVWFDLPFRLRSAANAQSAPVVPEEKPIPNTLSMYAVDAVAAIAEVKGWNACRAAMLQVNSGGDDGPTDDERVRYLAWDGVKVVSRYRHAQPVPVVLKDHQIRELVNQLRDIAIEYHGTQQLRERIARVLRAAMLQAEPVTTANKLGNSLVIQDTWIPVSERMPEDEQEVLTINRMGHRFVSFFDKHSGLFFDRLDAPSACCIEHVLVTHWMPLPAAPQEVK